VRAYDIIAKKRDGLALKESELKYLIDGYVQGVIPDYQISAFTMAVFFQGMTNEETAALTKIMLESGDRVDLSGISGIKVDKHSTGGVGDKLSLIVGPLVAAAGIPVAKMSGRGLGHTGGTIDKLSSIPGFQVQLSTDQFIKQVREIGLAIVSQTGNLVPADKKLYALRDVTATVESLPLIASSIMSKKLASGAEKIVLDVKVGSGAFMKSKDEAFQLARAMVKIGQDMNRETVAVISNMDEPLGNMVGNALEVEEAIEVLSGGGPKDLLNISLELGAWMITLAGAVAGIDEAKERLAGFIDNKSGLNKLAAMIRAQGGDDNVVNDTSILPQGKHVSRVYAPQSGVLSKVNAHQVGLAAMTAGAGRSTKEDNIDLGAGIKLAAKMGQKVKKGELLAEIYAESNEKAQAALKILERAYAFGEYEEQPMIFGTVTSRD